MIDAFLMMLHAMSPYLLLGFLIAGVLHAFVPSRLYASYLSGTGWRSVVNAALLGIPLPLCSCGVLPTAVSLRRNGASRAASTSFLIATPQTGVDSIAATYSMMGLPFAVLRPVAALVTALLGGTAVGRMERNITDDNIIFPKENADGELPATFWGRCVETVRYGLWEMMQNIGRWLLIGLVVAALITVLLPDDFFQTYAQYPLLNMLIIVLVAVPMYVCATGSIPIAAALMLKGLSPGCALVFLMAGPAASMASVLVVAKAFGKKSTAVYLASIILGAVGFGLLVDYWPGLQHLFTSAMPQSMTCCSTVETSWFNWVCSALLLALLIAGIASNYWKSHQLKNKAMEKQQFKVKGMMCNHCTATVEKGLGALDGVTSVTADLASGIVYVEGNIDEQAVKDKITDLGYEVE